MGRFGKAEGDEKSEAVQEEMQKDSFDKIRFRKEASFPRILLFDASEEFSDPVPDTVCTVILAEKGQFHLSSVAVEEDDSVRIRLETAVHFADVIDR